jgi:lipid-A-disaccharide synthase-like uncharacterized protein
MLLAYAIYRLDPVIIFGQLFGVVVYSRNLILIHRRNHEDGSTGGEPAVRPFPKAYRQAG